MRTMTAWTQDGYGPASAVRLAESPIPVPGRGEVLLRLHATSLNAGDARLMLGDPLLVRPAFGLRRPRNPVRGMDVAGVVLAVGEGVDDIAVGDETVGELPGGGGLAPLAIAPAKRLVRRPEGVAPGAAASLPIAAGTAWQALELGGVGPGARVLVIGATGGVGTFAVQLAAARGAVVHATAGEHARELVAGLGAELVLGRDAAPAEAQDDAYDAVIDIVGTAPLRALRRLVVRGGAVVLVSGHGGRVWGPVPRMVRAALLSLAPGARIRPLAAVAKPEVLRELLALAERGSIAPVIAGEYAFEEAGTALARIAEGHVVGKLIVRIGRG